MILIDKFKAQRKSSLAVEPRHKLLGTLEPVTRPESYRHEQKAHENPRLHSPLKALKRLRVQDGELSHIPLMEDAQNM